MNKILISVVSIIILIAIGYGLYNVTQPQSSSSPAAATTSTQVSTPQTSNNKQISSEELSKSNGKSGAACWVAVDNIIYDASNSDSFKDGVHVQSKGQVQCGRDESASIGSSPHGSGVLSGLPVVGTLAN